MANEAKVVITGDSSGAVAAIKRLNTEFGALQAISAKAMGLGIVGAAATVTAAMVKVTKAVIDNGDALNKLSQKTGLAVEDLSKLQYASDLSGVSTEALQKGLVNLAAGMAEAATGAGPMADKYAKLGISLRNADGTIKSSGAVLGELADRFAAMPDGVEKTALATDIFGKKLGAEMIPLLNGGAAGLKAMGDEAEALGLVMGSELAKQSEAFNDNLERLSKLSTAAGISIGNALIPALNEYLSQLIDARKAGLGFWQSIGEIGLSNPFKTAQEQVTELTQKIEALRSKSSSLSSKLSSEFGGGDTEAEIAALEKLRKYYELQAERQTGDGVQSAKEIAAKRERIERDLQAKLAEIAQLRAIAEGKVSAEILDTDDKRVAAQIKNAEKVRDAMSAAWKSALKDAEDAGAAAAKLFDDAANTRSSAADRSAAKRRSALSPEDQQAEIQKAFDSAASAASNAAAQARYAEMFGRTENAAKLAKEAERAAEKAARLADQIDDPELGARAIEQAAEIQAQLLEAQARRKQDEQAAYQKQAETTAAQVAQLDQMITDLQTKAAAIRVEADISAAEGQLATLKQQLDALQDKTITVTVNQVSTTGAPLGGTGDASATGSFATGGYTGPGGKYQPAGIVHAGEFVLRQEVVRQRGAIEFLSRFNREGLAALRGYASGGLVGNLRVPSVSPRASAIAPVVINLPGIGKANAMMTLGDREDFTMQIKRAALKHGGRR